MTFFKDDSSLCCPKAKRKPSSFSPVNHTSYFQFILIAHSLLRQLLHSIICPPVHSILWQNSCVFSGLYHVTKNTIQIAAALSCLQNHAGAYLCHPRSWCLTVDIGDKSGCLPVWMRIPVFPIRQNLFLILINHRASLKWNRTECNAHQGVWQNTICF